MSSSSQQQESGAPPLCAAGCGFFGNPATHGMCSVCYKKHHQCTFSTATAPSIKPKADDDARCAAAGTLVTTHGADDSTAASVTTFARAAVTPEAAAKKTEPARCPACYKKVGLLGFLCRCGKTFCARHRHAEEHACCIGRDAIARANPVVKGEKLLNKI